MRLDELSTLDENFEEHEEEALRALSHDEEGLAELLDYLSGMDSYEAWRYLFEEYDDIMSEELFYEMKERAIQLFEYPLFRDVEYIYNMKRVWLPKEESGKKFAMTIGNSNCLILFGMEEWKKYMDYFRGLPSNNEDVRWHRRKVFGQAQIISVREDGAIEISEFLHQCYLAKAENLKVYQMTEYLEKKNPKFIYGREYAKYVIAAEE